MDSNLILLYLSRVLKLNKLPDFDYTSKVPFEKVSRKELSTGTLNRSIVENLFRRHAKNGSKDWDRPISIIISLATLELTEEDNARGLLLLPAWLDKSGKLSFDLSQAEPWIPRSRLKAANNTDSIMYVGLLSKYWRYTQKDGEDKKSRIESWSDYLEYAESIYEAVNEHEENPSAFTVTLDECFLREGSLINASDPIINLYSYIRKEPRKPRLFERMVNGVGDKYDSSRIESAEEKFRNMDETAGSMNSSFPLAPSQRLSTHAFCQGKTGDVIAVSGPPGTGKTTLLQSIVANLIVSHALENKAAPIIVGTSTNNQAITNIIDSFVSVAPNESGPLNNRWLLQVNLGDEGPTITDDPLSGIATYFPSKVKEKEARQKGYLCDSQRKDGVYSTYSSSEYLEKARSYYLASLAKYAGTTASTLSNAMRHLHNHLCDVDKCRKECVRAAKLIYSNDQLRNLSETEIRETITGLEQEGAHCQERIRYWSSKRPKRTILSKILKRGQSEEASIVAIERQPDEMLAIGCKSVEEVFDRYSSRLDEINDSIRPARIFLDQRNSFIMNLKKLRAFVDRAGIDTSALDDPAILLADSTRLDEALDTTARVVEFWLSVHYYEGMWLNYIEKKDIIAEGDRWKTNREFTDVYWLQMAALTPCFVMTEYQLPKLFSYRKSRDEKSIPCFEKIDLLIVDEAGQVDSAIGLGAFALAKRAVVVGDVHQLSPVWGFEEQEDMSVALDCGLRANDWNCMKEAGLTASAPSNLMKVAMRACKWAYDKDTDGLFLSEHRRCVDEIIRFCNDLVYNGKLEPKRGSANDPASKNAAMGALTPFGLIEVEHSESISVGSSRKNTEEARAISRWISENFDTVKELYSASEKKVDESNLIGVVTPFVAQAKEIQRCLVERDERFRDLIKVGTAHVLQGAERPIVLFSVVYGNRDSTASFIENNPSLTNVAVSRAKDVFIVFCSPARLKDEGKTLRLIRHYASKESCSLSVSGDELTPVRKNGLSNTTEEMSGEPATADGTQTREPPICKKCGSTMVKRTAKKGQRAGTAFWGCSAFPKCRYTINID